jgi:hypothetical protein
MKNIFYLFILLALFTLIGCDYNKNSIKEKNYTFTKIDTTYLLTDRTKIDKITRYIYLERTSFKNGNKSLSLSTTLNEKDSKFYLISASVFKSKENKIMTNSQILSFNNIEEIKEMFNKIDSLNVGEELKERKKTKHYEIKKNNSNIHISQFTGSIDIPNTLSLSIIEFERLKVSLDEYLKEEETPNL